MAGKHSKDILPQQVKQRLAKGEQLRIIDVREPEEWESGHIPGSKLIPLGLIGQRHKDLDRSKEYILVCRSGNRSGIACEFLEERGYKVANMSGGMLRWDGDIE